MKNIKKNFDLADTAIIEVAKENPVIIITEDSKLVSKARSIGLIALTPYELISMNL